MTKRSAEIPRVKHPMHRAMGEQLARSTASHTFAPRVFALALLSVSASAADFQQDRDMTRLRVVSKGGASPTHVLTSVVQQDLDSQLAASLVSVFASISNNQHELDKDAKRILYSRMRELYRR